MQGAGRDSGLLAPRVSALLHAVQRGDYGALTSLLGSSHRERREERANFCLLAALLVEASGREHLDCIEFLLQKMMKPSPKRNLKKRGYFPMHTAAGAGAIESVELLLSAGLSPKTRDHNGRTPLHLAAAQGSVDCVAFLCTVARRTVLSRDRVAGDTPLHFAVRARRGVCVEVLLSHARGNFDILLEPNARGETPLDVATTLGDRSLLLRSRSATEGGGRRASSEDAVDIQRIMAVWEKFFENAAMACVGGWDPGNASGDTSTGQHVEDRRLRGSTHVDAGWREGSSVCQLERINQQAPSGVATAFGGLKTKDRPARAWMLTRAERSASDGYGKRRAGSKMSNHIGNEDNNIGDEEIDWRKVGAYWPRGMNRKYVGIGRDRQLSPTPLDSPDVARTRFDAWETSPIDLARGHEVETFNGIVLQGLIPGRRSQEGLNVQVDRDESAVSPDDAGLHRCRTPSDDESSTEAVWSSKRDPTEVHSSSSSPVGRSSGEFAAAISAGLVHRPQMWIACWDTASESVYYWHSKSGEVTWNAPPPSADNREDKKRCGFPSCVWDPQREAFFTIDEAGTSRWLDNPSTLPGVEGEGAFSTFAPSLQGTHHDWTTTCSSEGLTVCPVSQGEREATAAVRDGSLSTGTMKILDEIDAAGDGEEVGDATGSAVLPPEIAVVDQNVNVHYWPDSKTEAGWQGSRWWQDDSDDDDFRGFYDAEGGRNSGDVSFSGEEQPPGTKTTAASAAPTLMNIGSADLHQSTGIEFFDTTCEHHHQLSAWIQWCAPSSGDGDETPPYFVNEDTGASSWVLPPEAVAASGGWLRAWSEEHQARFFADQWTGRVTWELEDLEAEWRLADQPAK